MRQAILNNTTRARRAGDAPERLPLSAYVGQCFWSMVIDPPRKLSRMWFSKEVTEAPEAKVRRVERATLPMFLATRSEFADVWLLALLVIWGALLSSCTERRRAASAPQLRLASSAILVLAAWTWYLVARATSGVSLFALLSRWR